jgi:alcohol dehydrogenase (cytochrome c)
MRVAGKTPTAEGTLITPGNQGGTNWYSPSFSSHTGLFYIPSWVNYTTLYVKQSAEYVEGGKYAGGAPVSPVPMIRNSVVNLKTEADGYGAVRAIDPKTGDLKWEFKMSDFTDSGILTTDSDVLFTGDRDGYFFGLDARNGNLLWKASVGGAVTSSPISFSVNGRQYVAISAGSVLFCYALRQ